MSLYDDNIQHLTTLYPRFREDILDRFSPEDDILMEITPGDTPTARICNRYLHSRHNPLREADRIITSICGNSVGGVGVFLGFGLGYQVEAFCRSFPDAPIIIVESRPSLFLQALKVRDFSHIFLPRVSLLLGSTVEELSLLLGHYSGEKIHLISLTPICEQDSEYYRRAREITEAGRSRRKVNTATLKRFGKRWVRNLARNIDILESAGNVGDWAGIFSDIPACIFAAGPSLDEALPYLDTIRRRALLISSDTAARVLMREGITPDFVIIVDPQYWNTRHLDGLDLSGSILISEPAAHPNIFHGDFRALYLSGSVFPLGSFLETDGGKRYKLGAGGSVATTAWDFGRLVGGSPLILAGLDLGFPDKKTHFSGSYFEERIRSLGGRFETHEQGIFRYLHNGYPFFYENYEGGKVLTDKRLEVYRQWFEEQISLQTQESSGDEARAHRNSKQRTFTLSTVGIRIRGIEPYDIHDLSSFPERRDEIDKKLDRVLSTGTTVHRGDTKNRVATLASELQDLRKNAVTGIKTVERLLANEEERPAPSGTPGRDISQLSLEKATLLEELNEIDREILQLSSRKIAGFLITPILQEIDENTGFESPTLKENLRLTKDLYREIIGAIDFHLDLFS